MCDILRKSLSGYVFKDLYTKSPVDITMPPLGDVKDQRIYVEKDGNIYAHISITISEKDKSISINSIEREKLKSNNGSVVNSTKGLGKLILYFLACVAKKIRCLNIIFEASSSKRYNANAQANLETYYNSLGFIKEGGRTHYGTQYYSTPVETIISRIESEYKPESSGGKRETRRKTKRRYRKSTRK